MERRFLISLFVLLLLVGTLFFGRDAVARGSMYVGNQFFGEGTIYWPEGADGAYRLALFFDEDVLYGEYQRSRVAFLKGDFTSALALIESYIQRTQTSIPAAYYMRGLIYGYKKDYSLAEKDFLYFLEHKPTSWAANNDLAWIYFAQSKFQKAEERARIGLATNPQNAWLLLMHGMALYNLGRTGEAGFQLDMAKRHAAELTKEDWMRAYPGNHPAIAGEGLHLLRQSIDQNIDLVNK